MAKPHSIFIAGAGGIGQAAGLLLRELWDQTVDIYLGDIQPQAIKAGIEYIMGASMRPGKVVGVLMPTEGSNPALDQACAACDVLLDCLPGSQAPRMAQLALDNRMHYANLTEYVAETDQIKKIASQAETGFILQTGLAPGYIGVLAMDLYHEFRKAYQIDEVERISMKVGALTRNANPPHYYGFTWSPIGVATEYVKPAIAVRNHGITTLPSLSERELVLIDGQAYEADLTSGGAADLPEALASKARNLEYKTLRYPGHYAWVDSLIQGLPASELPDGLEKIMLDQVPSMEDDVVVLHAYVQGRDKQGMMRLREASNKIYRMNIGGRTLRAIQSTTAAPLVECARLLLEGKYKGVVLQSQLDSTSFLNGPFVQRIYGKGLRG